jgi:RNA polymerase sigma-70 factor (ECF subfamily)
MNVTHDITTVIRDHQPLVRRALRRFGVQERDVPDATQDVLIVVHRRLPTFEGRSKLSTWIYRIAFHVASEHRRRACNRREVLEDVETTTASETDRRDSLEQLTRALNELHPDKRDVLVDFELDEQPMAMIAARLGIPLKTAFSRLYAARREMSRRLRDVGLAIALPWWPRQPLRFQPSLTLFTSLAAVVLLVPELHAHAALNHPIARPITTHVATATLAAVITERVDPPPRAPNFRPAHTARRNTIAHTVIAATEVSQPPIRIDADANADTLIVFHDSDGVLTPRLPPPMLAELPPAPAREPRIQLRGVRDRNWSLQR